MHILFFAQLQDAAGCHDVELAAASPLNTPQLWTELVQRFPALAAHRSHVRLARNWEYAAPDAVFADSDEVALIPPVSGG